MRTGTVLDREPALAARRERCQVLVDGVLDALEDVGILIAIAREVERTVGDVAAELRPRDAVDGAVLAVRDAAVLVFHGPNVGREEPASDAVEAREALPAAHG